MSDPYIDEPITIELRGAEIYVGSSDGAGRFFDPDDLADEVPDVTTGREKESRLTPMSANATGVSALAMNGKRVVVDLDEPNGNVVRIVD